MPQTKTEKSSNEKSSTTSTTERKSAIESPSQTDPFWNLRATRSSPQLTDGDAFQRWSGTLLTPPQVQMLLGTMLGDGYMSTRKTRQGNPRYESRHGYVQHDYNTAKYRVLQEFVNNPPEKKKNGGYGDFSSYFATRNCPELHPIAALCLHRGKKRVTRTWLDQMTCEAISWWHMDDGTLQSNAIQFNTQGFTKRECTLLASWLRRMGFQAWVKPSKSRHNPDFKYHVVTLSVDATYKLMPLIRPFAVPSMVYKFNLPSRQSEAVCPFCQKTFKLKINQAKYEDTKTTPCCGSAACKRKRHKQNNEQLMANPEKREAKNTQSRERYYADHEGAKKAARQHAKKHREKNPESIKAAKARYLAKKQAERRRRPWTCQECKLTEPQGDRDSRAKYCESCREIVTARQKKSHESRKRTSSESRR